MGLGRPCGQCQELPEETDDTVDGARGDRIVQESLPDTTERRESTRLTVSKFIGQSGPATATEIPSFALTNSLG